jgi:hypothetical protein
MDRCGVSRCMTMDGIPNRKAGSLRNLAHLLILGAGTSMAVCEPAQAQWSVTVLHPAGTWSSIARAAGGTQQVGWAELNNGEVHASLWSSTAASWVDLHPAGAVESSANAMNGMQQVGGVRFSGGALRAALWSGTAASWVDLHPVGATESVAYATNGTQQGGFARFAGRAQASLWSGTAASRVDLHIAGATESVVLGMSATNQSGHVVLAGGPRASLWRGTPFSWVDLHPAGALGSSAFATSGTQQVGIANIGGVVHASLWNGTAASWVDLHPALAIDSRAFATTGTQQVGGAIFRIGGVDVVHAGLWSGSAASWTNLHAFLPSIYRESAALGIWSDGANTYISGWGLNSATGVAEALLWTQTIPAPGAVALLGLAGALAARRRRRSGSAGPDDFCDLLSEREKPLNRLGSTSWTRIAMSVAIFALVPVASADIVYVDLPDVTLGWGAAFDLDINQDGAPDIHFVAAQNGAWATCAPGVDMLTVYYWYAAGVAPGELIGVAGQTWSPNPLVVQAGCTFIPYCSFLPLGEPGYLGARLHLPGGGFSYVWSRASWFWSFDGGGLTATLTLHDYAYETTPDTPIAAGSIACSEDCNQNGQCDRVDILFGYSTDANGNQIPDECEITPPFQGAGSHLRFPGGHAMVDVPGLGTSMPTQEITIEFWQYITSIGATATFGLRPHDSSNRVLSHTPWADGDVYWDFGSAAGPGRLSYRPGVDLRGAWHHFAFVASQSGNYMAIYRNGVLEAWRDGFDGYDGTLPDFEIGNEGEPYLDAGFTGHMDEFRIWGSARSATEIAENFDRIVDPASPGLVAYYRFDEASGTVAVDLTGQHDGILVNGVRYIVPPIGCDPDVNCDGSADGFDIETMEQALAGEMVNFCQADADFNRDGSVDGFDIESLEQAVGGSPCP